MEALSAQELSLLQYPVQVTEVSVAEGQEGSASAVYRITGVIRGKPFSVMKSISSLDNLCVGLARVSGYFALTHTRAEVCFFCFCGSNLTRQRLALRLFT